VDVYIEVFPVYCQNLEVYVFDDDEQEGEQELPGYVGVAHVPLKDLSQGKSISGSFKLEQVRKTLMGTSIAWY